MSITTYRIFANVINTILGVISLLLILDVILKFFSANSATPIVMFIYSVSNFLMTPFAGIVPSVNIDTRLLDIVAIISLFFYLAAGYLLLGFIQNFTRATVIEEEEYPQEEYPEVVHYHKIRKPNVRKSTTNQPPE